MKLVKKKDNSAVSKHHDPSLSDAELIAAAKQAEGWGDGDYEIIIVPPESEDDVLEADTVDLTSSGGFVFTVRNFPDTSERDALLAKVQQKHPDVYDLLVFMHIIPDLPE